MSPATISHPILPPATLSQVTSPQPIGPLHRRAYSLCAAFVWNTTHLLPSFVSLAADVKAARIANPYSKDVRAACQVIEDEMAIPIRLPLRIRNRFVAELLRPESDRKRPVMESCELLEHEREAMRIRHVVRGPRCPYWRGRKVRRAGVGDERVREMRRVIDEDEMRGKERGRDSGFYEMVEEGCSGKRPLDELLQQIGGLPKQPEVRGTNLEVEAWWKDAMSVQSTVLGGLRKDSPWEVEMKGTGLEVGAWWKDPISNGSVVRRRPQQDSCSLWFDNGRGY